MVLEGANNNFKLQTTKHHFLGSTWLRSSFEGYILESTRDTRIFNRARIPIR